MIKKLLYFGFPVLVLIFIVYYNLGGFNTTQIELAKTDGYIISGYLYEGPYDEDSLMALFHLATTLVMENSKTDRLVVVNYQHPSKASDSIRQLLGTNALGPKNHKDALFTDTIIANKVIRAKVIGQPLVISKPGDTRQEMIKYAQDNDLITTKISIEEYVGNDEIWVSMPLK